jgi:pullulanase/glycogen debranching enzyme
MTVFTMNDLVSYNHKHNLANGENNRDGKITISPTITASKAKTSPADRGNKTKTDKKYALDTFSGTGCAHAVFRR